MSGTHLASGVLTLFSIAGQGDGDLSVFSPAERPTACRSASLRRMTSINALNHGRKCMEELDRFSHLMGWTFRNLDSGDCTELYSPRDEPDLSHTAFGDVVKIPSDFVAPTSSSSSTRPRHKTTNDPSRIYRKRATGPTASSSAKTHPGEGRSSKLAGSSVSTTTNESRSPLQHKKRSHKSGKPISEPVDFVYDVNVRRKLRENLDAERRRILQEANAREARLRAENKWVFDKRDTSPPRRKQAWRSSSPKRSSHHITPDHPNDDTKSSTQTSKPHVRTTSDPRKRSTSSSTSSSTCHLCPSSLSSSYQRHRGQPYTAQRLDEEDVEASIRAFERRLHTQWSLHTTSS